MVIWVKLRPQNSFHACGVYYIILPALEEPETVQNRTKTLESIFVCSLCNHSPQSAGIEDCRPCGREPIYFCITQNDQASHFLHNGSLSMFSSGRRFVLKFFFSWITKYILTVPSLLPVFKRRKICLHIYHWEITVVEVEVNILSECKLWIHLKCLCFILSTDSHKR